MELGDGTTDLQLRYASCPWNFYVFDPFFAQHALSRVAFNVITSCASASVGTFRKVAQILFTSVHL